MSERRDDTTERDEPSRDERERKPGSYYYDDSTGYEIYDPAKDEDEDEDDERSLTRDNTEGAQKRSQASQRILRALRVSVVNDTRHTLVTQTERGSV